MCGDWIESYELGILAQYYPVSNLVPALREIQGLVGRNCSPQRLGIIGNTISYQTQFPYIDPLGGLRKRRNIAL